MIRVALTGNIASGKSTVEAVLKELGYSCLNTDDIAHRFLENNHDVINAFKNFEILDRNGAISREKLGKIVFHDKKMLKTLENIIHPLVRKEIQEFFEAKKDENIVFVAIPQLFESSMQELFDKTVLVYCDDNIRIERLKKRNNYTEDYAKIRINAQISQDKKVNLCDFVIDNSSTLENLQSLVKTLPEKLLS